MVLSKAFGIEYFTEYQFTPKEYIKEAKEKMLRLTYSISEFSPGYYRSTNSQHYNVFNNVFFFNEKDAKEYLEKCQSQDFKRGINRVYNFISLTKG